MIFNSFTYLIFLLLVVYFYWQGSIKFRLILLLSSSICFYGFWNFLFVPLLFCSILVDYTVSLLIHRSPQSTKRKYLLLVSLISNFSLLGFFKYFYFFSDNLSVLANLIGKDWSANPLTIVLPLGISFYTFQSVSYTIDVYRGNIPPIRSFLLFSNYVTFFPQLVAGPILRAGEIVWQLQQRPPFEVKMLKIGIVRILGGIGLKVLLADNIAKYVNLGFAADPQLLSVIDVSTLAFLFGFQIYFDFAAYSHIAIGSALLMGIKFPENFNFPYHAKSPRDFWRRWHISLSSWIRDYLYLPLMGLTGRNISQGGIGQRVEISSFRSASALFLTWAVMGLWHGAGWTFILWGIWHAIIIFVHRLFLKMSFVQRLPSLIFWAGSLFSMYFIMLGWILFRAETIPQALMMLEAFLEPSRWFFMGLRENAYLVAALTSFLVLSGPIIFRVLSRLSGGKSITSLLFTWVVMTFSIAVCLVFLRPVEQFIYFQF